MEEEVKGISLPDFEMSTTRMTNLGVLGGCLSVCTCSNLTFESHEAAEIWMMKDYGVKESWEKVFAIPQLMIARPLCFSTIAQQGVGCCPLVRTQY